MVLVAAIEIDEAHGPARWVEVAFPPGAVTLIGTPSTGGLAWAAGFRSVSAAVSSLIAAALSVAGDA